MSGAVPLLSLDTYPPTPPYPNRSMSSVLGKIEEDQRDVNQKSIENDELQLKLVMCPHLP